MKMEIILRDASAPIPCDICRGSMRFIGCEPHAVHPHTDVYTYECTPCDNFQVVVVPLVSGVQPIVASNETSRLVADQPAGD